MNLPLDWLAEVGVRAGSAGVVRTSTALLLAGNTVTEEAALASALEAAGRVGTFGVGVTVVSSQALAVRLAFVKVHASFSTRVVPVAGWADALVLSAASSGWTVLSALWCKFADETIAFVALGAFALVGV